MVKLKRGRSKAAAEAVASHSDLLSEILLRLPAKSLLSFRKVSRQWYNLISSTQFCLEHTRRNLNPRPIGMFFTRPRSTVGVQYVKLDKDYRVKSGSRAPCKFPNGLTIIDSCNGLLLCSRPQSKWHPAKSHIETKLYVCNPTTKHVARIPGLFEWDKFSDNIILAFDPCTPEKYYNVICFRRKYEYLIDVYESETGSWRQSTTVSRDTLQGGGVFWNGAVHWVDMNEYALYCFDLKQGCFRRTISLPTTGVSETFNLKACQGHLYVFKVDGDPHPPRLTFYEMEHDFSCLSVKYSIRHDDLVNTIWSPAILVLGIFLGEEGQLFIVTRAFPKVYTYNANVSNSFPFQTTISRKYLKHCCNHIVTESLAPV